MVVLIPVILSVPGLLVLVLRKSGLEDSSTSSSSSCVAGVVQQSAAAAAVPPSSTGGVGDPPSAPLIPAPDPPSGLPSTGDNLDGSHTAEKQAVTTDEKDGSRGAGSTGVSTINTPTGGRVAINPLGSSGVPLSPSPSAPPPSTAGVGGSSTKSGLERDTGDGITDSTSHKTEDINKNRSQDNGGNQGKNDASQIQGNRGSSQTSSAHTAANKQTQDTMAKTSKPQTQTQEERSTSEDLQQQGTTTNNNKQQTRDQRNAGTPTDPKTVSNDPSNKGATKTPKPEPFLTTGNGSKINSTTTTKMAEDVQPKTDANETLKTPATTLAKQTKMLERLRNLDKSDDSSSTPLVFTFATLVTLSLVYVVPVF